MDALGSAAPMNHVEHSNSPQMLADPIGKILKQNTQKLSFKVETSKKPSES